MLPEVQEIQRRRLMLRLTQTQLARRAGVSQSLVAKLERGLVDAAYSKVKHLFETLEGLEAGRESVLAEALSNKPVVGVQASDPASKAIRLMQRHDYSQLPVFEGGRVVGSISEGSVTEYLAEGLDSARLPKLPIKELMGGAFPQVGAKTPRDAVVGLLRHFPAVLVVKGGRVTEIVTRADLFKVVRG